MAFRVNHLHLKTPNPRKTADFYVEFAGAQIVSERAGPDGRKTFRLDLHGVPLNITDYLSDQKLEQHYGRGSCQD
jgi:catechol 2,3-dioxygenase-like lactoylglutathione lyase family enzyme